jgi:hypothetical protein
MKNKRQTLLATAAISGLLGGISHLQARNADTNAPAAGQQASALAPTVHGCSGMNDCKGAGGCKTADHSCKFLNSCKGKGGCDITDQDVKDWQKKQKADKDKASAPVVPAVPAKPATTN